MCVGSLAYEQVKVRMLGLRMVSGIIRYPLKKDDAKQNVGLLGHVGTLDLFFSPSIRTDFLFSTSGLQPSAMPRASPLSLTWQGRWES